jgi:hypothetical protein
VELASLGKGNTVHDYKEYYACVCFIVICMNTA